MQAVSSGGAADRQTRYGDCMCPSSHPALTMSLFGRAHVAYVLRLYGQTVTGYFRRSGFQFSKNVAKFLFHDLCARDIILLLSTT
jgi:hypothetical protein